jgi:hypothetical protein
MSVVVIAACSREQSRAGEAGNLSAKATVVKETVHTGL